MLRAAANDATAQRAQDRHDVRDDVPEHERVAACEVLPVHHALADAVVHVEALELVGRPPVVVPDDEVRRVADPASRPKPAIRQVIVLGGGTDPAVEAAEIEDGGPAQCHALGVEDEVGPADVLARVRVVDRRGNHLRVAARTHTTRHDLGAVLAQQRHAAPNPRRIDGAVIVRQQDDLVRRLAKAEVERGAEPSGGAAKRPRADPAEGRHDAGHGIVAAGVDDEDLVRLWIAVAQRFEAHADQLQSADRREYDRRAGSIHGNRILCRMLPFKRPSSRPSCTATAATSAFVRARTSLTTRRAHDRSSCAIARRRIPAGR